MRGRFWLSLAAALLFFAAVVAGVQLREEADARARDILLAGEITRTLTKGLDVDVHVGGLGVGVHGGVDVHVPSGHGPPPGHAPPGNNPPPDRDRPRDTEDDAGRLLKLGREGLGELLEQLDPGVKFELLAKCQRARNRPADSRGIGPNLRALCAIILSLP